jgi:guanosine-3',5'-bis(diphosphate) 3'-pyrophosphohydrolase
MISYHQKESLLWDAVNYAWTIHSDQTRKDGITPYITHPLAVMIDVMRKTDDLNTWIAAVCHDLLEDSLRPDLVYERLEENFGLEVVEIVHILTRRKKDKDEKYADYIHRIVESNNKKAMIIKLADLSHNLSTIDNIKDLDKRTEKINQYNSAYNLIWLQLNKNKNN